MDISADHPFHRFREAYLRMARELNYRPSAPGDGCGHVHLTQEQLRDSALLDQEASKYAVHFLREEDSLQFYLGCSDYETNQALVWVVEAARQLNSGHGGNTLALKLLAMAIKDVRGVQQKRRREQRGCAMNAFHDDGQ